MERIDDLINRKREIFSIYREGLAEIPGISMNPEPEGTVNGAWMPTVVCAPETGISREGLQADFAAENVDARVFFWPLSSQTMFKPVISNAYAWEIPDRAINLPSYHDVDPEDLKRVIAIIQNLVSQA